MIFLIQQSQMSSEEFFPQEIVEYRLGQRVDPPAFSNYQHDEGNQLLEESLRRDVAWSLANGLPSAESTSDYPLLGSWTAFNRTVSNKQQRKSLIEYMPVIN